MCYVTFVLSLKYSYLHSKKDYSNCVYLLFVFMDFFLELRYSYPHILSVQADKHGCFVKCFLYKKALEGMTRVEIKRDQTDYNNHRVHISCQINTIPQSTLACSFMNIHAWIFILKNFAYSKKSTSTATAAQILIQMSCWIYHKICLWPVLHGPFWEHASALHLFKSKMIFYLSNHKASLVHWHRSKRRMSIAPGSVYWIKKAVYWTSHWSSWTAPLLLLPQLADFPHGTLNRRLMMSKL